MKNGVGLIATVLLGSISVLPAYAGEYTIDGYDFFSAMAFGKVNIDEGLSKDEILLEMEGNTVTLKKAFVYSKGTGDGDTQVIIGDNKPRAVCIQTTKEARLHAIKSVENKGDYDVTGAWARSDGNVVYLNNCTFTFIK